jgi:formylglycine-generating enzyme required for sulfatase activity
MLRIYSQKHKQVVQLTEKIGSGGEGTVYLWPLDVRCVCKIYHDDVLLERGDIMARKLRAMLSAPPDDPMLARGQPTFAWPQQLVFDPENLKRVIGFVMPRITDSYSLHRLYSASDRRQLDFPTDSNGRALPEYYVMVAAARNLAEAFRLLHARGYVMADVNEDNIRFRTDATVSLIDNDSFQVRDRKSGVTFPVPVLKVEYWPVDSLEMHARREPLAITHDQFCLALFLFRLLMNGVHPFYGMGAPDIDPPSPVENIAAGRFPFQEAQIGGLRPPPHAPAFDGLPAEMREHFRSSFVEGARNPAARVDAATWVKVLDSAIATMKRCGRGHMYFAGARQCPSCELEDSRTTCPKGHRYYRAEGNCPRCRLERRRAARQARITIPPPEGATGSSSAQPTPVPVVNAQPFSGLASGQSAAHTASVSVQSAGQAPAPSILATPQQPAAANMANPAQEPPALPAVMVALQRIPASIRWWIAGSLAALFMGAIGWGAVHVSADDLDTEDDGKSSAGTISDPSAAQAATTPSAASTHTMTNPKDGATMVMIPAGTFVMGDDDQSDNTKRTVTLPGYWIYKNLVTVGQFKRFCKATGRKMPIATEFDPNWSKEDHPIVYVTWDDAEAYSRWADVSLPTEAQWEKAARGTDGLKYPWGNYWDASKCANSVGVSQFGTVAVGHFNDNPYGLSDMAGNALEWCADSFESNRQTHVLRGGPWYGLTSNVFRVSYRVKSDAGHTLNGYGFRCVKEQ